MIDTHAHYDDPSFDKDRTTVLERVFSVTEKVINIGISAERSQSTVELCRKYPDMYAAVGIHPLNIGEPNAIAETAKLAQFERVIAIGEIGLDYHLLKTTPFPDKNIQRIFFERQLELASDIGLPVVIHTRDSWGDTLEILHRYRPKGVVHCFSGSPETAGQILSLGMYIGFTGNITYPNAKKANHALKEIPLDRILLETDAPYQAPFQYKGSRCDSAMMRSTLAYIAQIKGESTEKTERITSENAFELFRNL